MFQPGGRDREDPVPQVHALHDDESGEFLHPAKETRGGERNRREFAFIGFLLLLLQRNDKDSEFGVSSLRTLWQSVLQDRGLVFLGVFFCTLWFLCDMTSGGFLVMREKENEW